MGQMMRALILQFEPFDGPEYLGERLTLRGVEWDVAHLYLPHDPVSLDGYDMLMALGGAMGVNDAARYPFLDEASDLFREAIRRGLACLGICLGGQLLASALGAPVSRQHEQEVGVGAVQLAPGAEGDPLLRHLAPVIETVQFHEDTFAVPAGGVVLATSASCATQVVRCGERAYALQFHPEASAETFAQWVALGYEGFAGPERAAEGPALARAVRDHEPLIRAHADQLFDNFISLAAAAPSAPAIEIPAW